MVTIWWPSLNLILTSLHTNIANETQNLKYSNHSYRCPMNHVKHFHDAQSIDERELYPATAIMGEVV